MTTALSIERSNELIRLFGESQKADMRAERRESMKSVLFDLPRRSSLGWQCLYEHEVPFLRELSAEIAPEEVGRRMRTIGARPYALQPFIAMCTYLGARQQRMLDLGLSEGDRFPEEDVESLAFLLDWWERLQRAYRSDGKLLPVEADNSLQILDPEMLEEITDHLRPFDEDRFVTVRRMAATVQLYVFILHGEQRDGIFGHGPYPGPERTTLWLAEFNDLRNTYLPWANTAARCPFPNIAVAYAARGVAVRCDMFGSVVVNPPEFGDRLTGVVVLTNENGTLRAIDDDALAEIQQAAADAQEELYVNAIQWDDRYKIEYGAPLFANHIEPFFELAGMDAEIGERIMAACQSTADRMTDELLGKEIPSVWRHMGSTEGDFFWPIVR